MNKEVRDPSSPQHGYLLPIQAHRALCLTRDHLKLLAQLAEPSSDADEDLLLSREQLYDLFHGIANDLDGVLNALPEKVM